MTYINYTTSIPNGDRASFASRKCIFPQGMPMMVTTIRQIVAKIENMKGVMDTNWNPRTRELTVRYDANKTSAHNIKHFVA